MRDCWSAGPGVAAAARRAAAASCNSSSSGGGGGGYIAYESAHEVLLRWSCSSPPSFAWQTST